MCLEFLATGKCGEAPVALEENLFVLVVFDDVLPIDALETEQERVLQGADLL